MWLPRWIQEVNRTGVKRLRAFLAQRRRTMWQGGWQVFARSVVSEHPVLDLIHESPISRGVFEQESVGARRR